MISRFYTQTGTIKRLQWTVDDDNNDIAEEVAGDNIKGHLQQASAELISNLADRYTISHIYWCDVDSEVRVGDVIEIGVERFGVRGIQDNSFVGTNKHLELQLERQTDNLGS